MMFNFFRGLKQLLEFKRHGVIFTITEGFSNDGETFINGTETKQPSISILKGDTVLMCSNIKDGEGKYHMVEIKIDECTICRNECDWCKNRLVNDGALV